MMEGEIGRSTINDIIEQRELWNERTVAIVRFALSLTGFWDILSLLNILPKPSNDSNIVTAVISVYLLVYSSVVLIISARMIYLKNLKYFVIFFDYLYIGMSFILDRSLTSDRNTTIWLIFAGCVVFYLINLLRYSRSSTIFAAVLSCILYASVSLYSKVPIVIIVQVGMALSLLLLIGFLITSSNLKMLKETNTKKMMERYLPPQLIGEMYKKNPNIEPGGENQKVTILFSDIRSFTGISEALGAKEVVALLNDYLSRMTDIIFAREGTIDKFVGDAIMTIFGAPIRRDDDAIRAVRTAIDMYGALSDIEARHPGLAFPLRIGVGIHTGDAIVGNIGSEKRLDYTVIGDNVNVSSRIEGLTKFYGCPIMISGTTYEEVAVREGLDGFYMREIDHVVVKGRSSGIFVYEVMPFYNKESRAKAEELKAAFEKSLAFYKNHDFSAARASFGSIANDGPSAVYLMRCSQFIENPPPKNWNGIFQMNVKR